MPTAPGEPVPEPTRIPLAMMDLVEAACSTLSAIPPRLFRARLVGKGPLTAPGVPSETLVSLAFN